MAKKKITNIEPETDTSQDDHITHLMELEDRLTNSVFNLKALINENVLSISTIENEMANAWNLTQLKSQRLYKTCSMSISLQTHPRIQVATPFLIPTSLI